MNIACLGWGSLIWNPGELPVRGAWNHDGPFLPVEFARESDDGRITLVITEEAKTVQTLWNLLNVSNLEEAKSVLAKREKISDKYLDRSIGFWEVTGRQYGRCGEIIGHWAQKKGLDAVIWTNLKFGFKDSRDVMPSCSAVISRLESLKGEIKDEASEYIAKAPGQIDTDYRKQILDHFGWMPIDV